MQLGVTRAIQPPTRVMATYRVADVAQGEPLKRQMASWYSDYAGRYDRDGYHTRIADRLIEGADIREGDRILDVATGTGLAGFAALDRAGPSGNLIGVDIAPEMLKVALEAAKKRKDAANIEFILSDAQKLDFEEESFDVVICSSALVLFPDEEWTLRYWRRFLAKGGRLAVHCFSENSYIRGKLIQFSAKEFGIDLIFSEPTGTVEKCRTLLEKCGYEAIRVEELPNGKFISLEDVQAAWEKTILHPMVQLPSLVDPATLEAMQQRYDALARERVTEDGIWDDDTILYVYGQKQNSTHMTTRL